MICDIIRIWMTFLTTLTISYYFYPMYYKTFISRPLKLNWYQFLYILSEEAHSKLNFH